MLLSKSDILSKNDLKVEIVQVPEWKGPVKIKVMSIAEQIEFEKMDKDKSHNSDLIFAMLVLCCIDDEGKHLFNKEDIPALKEKSSTAVIKLFKACLKLNQLNENDLEKKAKNS
jgi:hypothetical protein